MRGHRAYLNLSNQPHMRSKVLIAPRRAGHRQFSQPKRKTKIMEIKDPEAFNMLRASRKADREQIAKALKDIAAKRGAVLTVEREEPRNPGYCGAGIDLEFELNGVGAMISVNDLHGGEWVLIHWFNAYGPERREVRDFTPRFQRLSGDGGAGRPHHKSTSFPRDWYSLAMVLDAGLMLAARGEAFAPVTAEASAT